MTVSNVAHTQSQRKTQNLPAELTTLTQWVGWRREHRDGKPTKIPMRPDGKGKASTTDPATWGTIDQARAAARRYNFDGIGFVFTADDPYIGIDLDKCRRPETGEIADWAIDILFLLADAYAEASPSGTGIHIITQGRVPGGRYKAPYRGGVVEMYDRARYFTVTGVAL
jgi:primase-polymerase (primpol)-like protein